MLAVRLKFLVSTVNRQSGSTYGQTCRNPGLPQKVEINNYGSYPSYPGYGSPHEGMKPLSRGDRSPGFSSPLQKFRPGNPRYAGFAYPVIFYSVLGVLIVMSETSKGGGEEKWGFCQGVSTTLSSI